MPGWTAESSGSGERGTSCLAPSVVRNNAWRGKKEVLTLQHIQTDPSQTVDVRVVDLGQEADLGGSHRIVIGQEEFEPEDAT